MALGEMQRVASGNGATQVFALPTIDAPAVAIVVSEEQADETRQYPYTGTPSGTPRVTARWADND